jgi:hypothetical protein
MTCHERVCVMCIRFLLQDVQQFKSSRLSNMSNLLSCGRQDVVNYWNDDYWWFNGIVLL